MPSYSYTAISQEGEKTSGVEIAKTEQELAQFLHKKGYVLTSVEEQGRKQKNSFSLKNISLNIFGVPLKEKLVFTRNLKVMITAGVSLPKALGALAEQTRNKKMQKALEATKEEIVKGRALSEAMAQQPKVFSELFQNMVKAGEASGTLEEVLAQLTIQMERDYEVRSKIRGALLYPSVIIFAMLVIAVFMLTFVVPKLAATFADLEVELPATTKIIVGMGEFFAQFWYIVIIGFIVAVIGFLRALKTKVGKKLFDFAILKVPVISGIVKDMQTALTARTLSSLLAAGVPVVSALEITSRVLGNWYFREAIEVSSKEVQKGSKLSEVLKNYEHLYPVMIIQMIQVGEETGETTDILKKVAEFFEEEIDNVTKNLTSIIEPVLMLVIGVVVGFFAISMFQPMYSLVGAF